MSEHLEQCALIDWAKRQETAIPELRMLYAIPNGGRRHKRTAARLKAEGVKAGVFDLSLDVPKGIYHGLKIEMKYDKNKLTDNQKQWLMWYSQHGYCAIVCYDWLSAREMILDYLSLGPDD